MSGFTRQQIKKLVQKLNRAHVHTREVDGRQLDYIEGWFAVSEANAIFGFAGWDREMVHFERMFESRGATEIGCGYLARVRVTVRTVDTSVIREGTGFGQARARARGEAHERALKAAETDATKRALATFGNRFGLALYDKDQNGVTPATSAQRRSPVLNNTQRAQTVKSAAASSRPGCAGPEELTRSANIFVLRDADGEVLAGALSGEGFCTGMRQLLEAYDRGEELEQLKANNIDMLALLRAERPTLRSSKGEHFADILERLTANKRDRLATPPESVPPTSVIGSAKRNEHSQPVEVAAGSDAGLPLAAQPATGFSMQRPVSSQQDATRKCKVAVYTTGQEGKVEHEPAVDTVKDAALPPVRREILSDTSSLGRAAANTQNPSRIATGAAIDKSQLLIATTRRVRNKAHLLHVTSKPCLICEGMPCHAHHLTFAQPRGLSVKVSDEFTVPLCVIHHNALHAANDERAFWRQHDIDPLIAARELWRTTLGLHSQG